MSLGSTGVSNLASATILYLKCELLVTGRFDATKRIIGNSFLFGGRCRWGFVRSCRHRLYELEVATIKLVKMRPLIAFCFIPDTAEYNKSAINAELNR